MFVLLMAHIAHTPGMLESGHNWAQHVRWVETQKDEVHTQPLFIVPYVCNECIEFVGSVEFACEQQQQCTSLSP